MYTEDDTFRRLKRIPFEKMRIISGKAKLSIALGHPCIDLDKIYAENGWTRDEYNTEMEKTIDLSETKRPKSREGYIVKSESPYKKVPYV